MRKRARIDANQNEIAKALRAIGCSVLFTHQLGDGAGDLLIGFRGRNLMLELKDGDKPKSRQKLTKDETEFKSSWRGHYAVVSSVAEAIDEVRRNG